MKNFASKLFVGNWILNKCTTKRGPKKRLTFSYRWISRNLSIFKKNFATLREIIGIIYSGLYGNNTCDNFYGIFARLLWNFYLPLVIIAWQRGCLRGPLLLAKHLFHRSMEIFPVNTWDYYSEVNLVKFPKDFSQCSKLLIGNWILN